MVSVAGGGSGLDIHKPSTISVTYKSADVLQLDVNKDSQALIYRATGAPVKANQSGLFEYAFHPVRYSTDPNASCVQCHRPRNDSD